MGPPEARPDATRGLLNILGAFLDMWKGVSIYLDIEKECAVRKTVHELQGAVSACSIQAGLQLALCALISFGQ